MSVFRSNKQIYVQIIDDLSKTLASASSLSLMKKVTKKEQAAKVGEVITKELKKQNYDCCFLIAMVICITDALKRLLMQHVMVDLILMIMAGINKVKVTNDLELKID